MKRSLPIILLTSICSLGIVQHLNAQQETNTFQQILGTSETKQLTAKPAVAMGLNEWEDESPEGSTVYSIVMDPTNSNIIYAGTDDNGVFKSTDGGLSWSKFGSPGYGQINQLLIDPHNPDRLYLGFWRGMYRKESTSPWWANITSSALGQLHANDIAVDAADSSILYMLDYSSVHRSTDYGSTWNSFDDGLSGSVRTLKSYEANNTLYAGSSTGLYSLASGGTNWSSVLNGISVTEMDIDQTNGNLYVASWDSLHVSFDSGTTWNSYDFPSIYSLRSIAIDPTNPSVIYSTFWGDGVYKTVDGGQNWIAKNVGLSGDALTAFSIVVDHSNSQNVYLGTRYEGVFKSTDGGDSWNVSNGGKDIFYWEDISDLVVDYTDNQILYASFDGQILKTIDGGINWSAPADISNRSYCLTQDPGNNQVLYAGLIGGMIKTSDGWNSYAYMDNYSETGNINELIVDHSNSDVVWAISGHGKGIFKSNDAGTSWTLMDNGYETPDAYAADFAMDGTNPQVLYAILTDSNFVYHLYKTTDAGASWTTLEDSTMARGVTTDPLQSNVVYSYGYDNTDFTNKVRKSIDGGVNWTEFYTSSSSIWTVAVSPVNSNQVVVGGYNFEYTNDNGVTWNTTTGLPAGTAIKEVVYDPIVTDDIYAVTHFDGIFKATLTASTPPSLETDSLALVAFYHATDGPNWTDNTNWLTGPIDTWFGVFLTAGRVTEIGLRSNNLTGVFPPEFGDLDKLETLILSSNNLSDSIPVFFNDLTSLDLIDLQSNDLVGNPLAYLTSQSLERIHLFNNQLSGTIPNDLHVRIPNLTAIGIGRNNYTGSIPPEISLLTSLTQFRIDENNISGPIPPELGDMTGLLFFTAQSNDLTGTIPEEIYQLQDLVWLILSDNDLDGTLSNNIANLSSLDFLGLSRNQFHGVIPDTIATFSNLRTLTLENNRFHDLPDFSASAMQSLLVDGNNFTFEDIEPNLPVTFFNYVPQKPVGSPFDTTMQVGENFVYTVPVGGTANSYQWYKDGTLLPGDTTNTLTLNSLTSEDQGSYFMFASSSIVTDLVISSATISLTVDESCQSNFEIIPQELACSVSTFTVPIEAIANVSPEVIGLNFCIEYDTTTVSLTGNAVVGDVVHAGNPAIANYFLNTSVPGQVNGIVYFNANAPFPSYFNGQGTVIEVEFAFNNAPTGTTIPLTLCGVSESTLFNGDISHCSGSTTDFSVINEPTFTGTIRYWDKNGKPLQYDTLNPSAFIETSIVGFDQSCTQTGSAVFHPDLNGQFIYEVAEGDHLKISRDIPGSFADTTNCTNVMDWVNGADQNRAMRIATLDPSFIPSVYQMIAADVNMDGRVSAADVTFIAARSVMNICGFTSDGTNSLDDWVFVDETTLNANPAFSVSGLFPMGDGVGYSRDHVPQIPECILAPIDSAATCIATTNENYSAILLGDVTGNWKSSDGANGRAEVHELLALDFDRMNKNGNSYEIPIVIKETEVEALDFYLTFNSNKLAIDRITTNAVSFSSSQNVHGSLLLYSSYALKPEMLTGDIMSLEVSSRDGSEPMPSDFSSTNAYVNSEFVDITKDTELFYEDKWNIYPIPFNSNLTIDYLGNSEEEINVLVSNASGQIVENISERSKPGFRLKLDLDHLARGIYFVKIKTPYTTFTRRVVK